MVSIVVEIPNRRKRIFKVGDAESADSVLAEVERAVRKINADSRPKQKKEPLSPALQAARDYLNITEGDSEIDAIREEARKLREGWIRKYE